MQKKLTLLLIFLMLMTKISLAQEANWEIGISGGGAGYIGDLNQNNILQVSGLAAGLYVKRNFNPYLGFRLHYTYGQIKADDANSSSAQFRERNLRFKTSLNDMSALVDFNFFNVSALSGMRRRFTPYLFTGVGAVVFKPYAKYDGTKYRLDQLLTEGQKGKYPNYAFTIPYGGGVRYHYREGWTVFSEIGYRTAFTDYLDDVSGVYPVYKTYVGDYPNYINITDPSLNGTGEAGTQRGDFRKRDTYLFVSIGISFTFVNSKCYSM